MSSNYTLLFITAIKHLTGLCTHDTTCYIHVLGVYLI